MTDSLTIARSVRGSIGMLAMPWLMHPSTSAAGAEAGLGDDGTAGYAVGRLGVLGDCPVDNVVGAAFFWEPDTMRSMVARGRAIASPAQGTAVYVDICRAWGRQVLDGFDEVVELGTLLERVTSTASPLGAPTFVGWRDQPLPEPGPARTFQLAQTMRELRFGRHTVAVQAAGMSPLEAILSGPAGEWNAEFFGWPRPYPDVSSLADARATVEDTTDRLHAADFDVLDDGERTELRRLAKAARSHAEARSQG